MSKKNYPDKFKINKKLDPYIKNYYKHEIGVPDLTQNWLELFHGTVIDDLFTIMHANSDNQLKSEYVVELLEPFGFTTKGGGLGTNIVVLTHPYYPGVVFKIALDENGIADNFNDCLLQDMIPQYARVYARHPSGLVTVQERYFVMKPEWMTLYRNDIIHALRKLSNDFLIADLTPSMVLNYGIDRQGKFVFIDGSDLYPLEQIKSKDRLRCVAIVGSDKNGELKRCRGKCKYNDDFSQMICEKCGRTYIPIELRPRKEEVNMKNIFSNGFDVDDREEIDRRSREAMKTGHFEPYIPDRIKNQNNEEDDEEMRDQIPEGYHIQVWRDGTEKYKIAVQDGFHVVAVNTDNDGQLVPIVKPDKEDYKKKKNKKVVHNEEPDLIRVPQDVQTYSNPTPRNVPSDDYKKRLLKQKEEHPEAFKTYISNLIEVIGWDMIDQMRPVADDSKDEQIKALSEQREEAIQQIKQLTDEHDQYVENAKKEYDQLKNDFNDLFEKHTVAIDEFKTISAEYQSFLNQRDKEVEELRAQLANNTVIQNETDNSIIRKMQLDENPNCIHYQVVEETDKESSELPGIYYHIRGDVVSAYDNYALPIRVVVEGINSVMLAANTMQLRDFIYDAFDEALEDSNVEPVIIKEGEEAPDANGIVYENIAQAEQEEIVKSYTKLLDEDDDDGEEMTEDEEEEVLTRLTHNPNPNWDPRYETARDWADRI